ncbi:MAG: hypothetical protein RL106_1823 [Bacteroidota bacterium]
MNLKKELTFQYFFWNQIKEKKWLTTKGDEVEIVNVGEWNFSDGPDFKNASGTINGKFWRGDVEIHKSTSDWFLHGHQWDDAYNHVKLHVVYEVSASFKAPDLPTIALKCQWNPAPDKWFKPLIAQHIFNWDIKVNRWNLWRQEFDLFEAQMIAISRTLGRHIQGDAMESWAKQIPWSKIPEHWSILEIHAYFHWMAGHLDNLSVKDYYCQILNAQNQVFGWGSDYPRFPVDWRRKVSMSSRSSLRIAQMAQLFYIIRKHAKQEWWNVDGLSRALGNLQVPKYWEYHYALGQQMKVRQSVALSKSAVGSITSNLSVFILEENSSSLKKNTHHDQNNFRLL